MLGIIFRLMLLVVALGGCAMVSTHAVTDLSTRPKGVRLYAPRVLLLVDTKTDQTTIFVGPNFKRAYDLKPVTIFAKQDFKVELDDGVLKSLATNQDTTGFLTFLKEASQLATKAAGLPVSQNTIKGSFGLASGIYEFSEDGALTPLRPH